MEDFEEYSILELGIFCFESIEDMAEDENENSIRIMRPSPTQIDK